MSSTSIPQRSLVSPRAPSHNQNQSNKSARRSSQPTSSRDPYNPTSSRTIAQSADLPTDHLAPTQHSSAGSREKSSSTSVLGLPSTVDPSLFDDFFDLDQFVPNDGLTNNAIDLHTLEWVEDNSANLAIDGFDANPTQYTDLLQVDQCELGLGISFTQPEQYSNQQNTVKPNYGLELGLGSPIRLLNPSYDIRSLGLVWDPLQATSQIDDTTLGLSAIPGSGSFIPDTPQYLNPSQPQHMYPDPLLSLYTNNPYFPYTQQQYSGVNTGNTLMPTQYIDIGGPSAVQPAQKRKRSHFDSSGLETNVIMKRQRKAGSLKPIKSPITVRSQSSVSEDGSLSKPVRLGVLKPGEKPKKCEDKPWVRINNTTKGETTRTARINQHAEEGRKYRVKDIPHGDWSGTRYTFEYSQNNGMHEFKKRTMSARQMFEYITQYPGDNLRIWIQPVASDSARRYASASHSHCRFEKCPMRRYTGKGTAEVGNYRVAFDEKHKAYGSGVVDPYDCVGYAHLYCMERFLDFAYICRVADVRVDQRTSMEKEPNGHFASAFGSKHHHEATLAKKFIDAASRGRLADTPEFRDYPVHKEYERGEPKPHERTLVYALYCMNIKHRARSQMKQFILQRTIRPGSFPVHRGDLEVKLVDKKIEKLPEFKEHLKRGSKKDFDYSAYYDRFHPEIKDRVAYCMALREQFIAEDTMQKSGRHSKARRYSPESLDRDTVAVSSRKSKKRRPVHSDSENDDLSPRYPHKKRRTTRGVYNDDDDDDDIEEIQELPPPHRDSRPSGEGLRQKERINYAEPKDIPPLGNIPTLNVMDTAEAEYPLNTRKESCSNLFPTTNDPSWENFDLQPLDGSEALLTDEQLEALLNAAAYRRKSSTLSNGPYVSAVRSPHRVRGSAAVPRKASFNPQPVTQSKEFGLNDPPARVAGGAEKMGRRISRAAGRGEQYTTVQGEKAGGRSGR